MEGVHVNSTSQNQCSNNSNITSNQNHMSSEYIRALTFTVIAIGLPLTLMAIYSLYSMVRNHHVAPIYIINLLISDLIQHCCMIIEVAKAENVNKSVLPCIYLFGLFTSVYFMVCIALERYLVIAHLVWYRFKRTIKTSLAVCVVVWVLPLVYVILYYFFKTAVVINIILAVFLLPPFPLFIFFLVGTLRALSAAISVPSDEKRRIVGILVLVLLIYTLLYLPGIILFLESVVVCNDVDLFNPSLVFARLSPLADLVLYFFMRKGAIDKLLASVCCCRMDSNDISSPSV